MLRVNSLSQAKNAIPPLRSIGIAKHAKIKNEVLSDVNERKFTSIFYLMKMMAYSQYMKGALAWMRWPVSRGTLDLILGLICFSL